MDKLILVNIVSGFLVMSDNSNVIHRLYLNSVPQLNSFIVVDDINYQVNKVAHVMKDVEAFKNIRGNSVLKKIKQETIYVFVTENRTSMFYQVSNTPNKDQEIL